MPLRDHFHPPVSDRHSWDEIHGVWPTLIVRDLFSLLPAGYQAKASIHLGSPSEVDIATFDGRGRGDPRPAGEGGTATLAPPLPTATVTADLSAYDEYEVLVYDARLGRRLVAAIEIVSPSNKDRPETRRTFVTKVAALLHKGVCVSVVDLVTERHANLYAELLDENGLDGPRFDEPATYAVTLRARRPARNAPLLDVWFSPMELGRELPTLPIRLTDEVCVSLPLESSYEEGCRLNYIA